MKANYTMEFIGRLFEDLSPALKIEMLSVLYYDLSDANRDRFLREIENS